MSSQRGNVKKTGPPKHQNKAAWKNVYHDTSKQTHTLVHTEVSGVCSRCKDVIDWKIKYKKYKPLSQAKTCVVCKKKTVKFAYHTFCQECSSRENKCAKCGEKKDIVQKPSLSASEQAQRDSESQMELQMLPERKRRTYLRLQEKGLLPPGDDSDDDEEEDEEGEDEADNDSDISDSGHETGVSRDKGEKLPTPTDTLHNKIKNVQIVET